MSKILILTSRYPYPVIGGDRLRIYHICKALARTHQLTLASLCERPAELRHRPTDHVFSQVHRVYLPRWKSYTNALRGLARRIPLQLAYYASPQFRALVDRLLPEHDLVLAHLIRTAQFVPADVAVSSVLEMTDAISMNYERMRSLPQTYSWKKILYAFEQKRVARYESEALARFDKTWLVSRVDASYVDGLRHNAEVIPNGVDLSRLPYLDGGDGATIAFIGNMVSAQNQDGCLHFAQHVLPLLRAYSKLRLRVIGNCPLSVRRRLEAIEGVEVSGMFDRIEPHLKGVFCGVCSVRAAAGVQNKVLEYLAMGLPCVSTPQGAEGLRVRPGRDLLVYRSTHEAAHQILSLYQDDELRKRLAKAGKQVVAANYEWNLVYRRIEASVAELTNPGETLQKAG